MEDFDPLVAGQIEDVEAEWEEGELVEPELGEEEPVDLEGPVELEQKDIGEEDEDTEDGWEFDVLGLVAGIGLS